MESMIEQLKTLLNEYDNIVIGAGAGLSAAAGFEYGGENFKKYFKDMYDKYGYTDMYSAGFHPFATLEEKWGFWARYIYLNRYKEGAKKLYQDLYEIVKDKNYFVITTNVDHQFQLAGFDKKRLYYMQGDYGLFQCSKPCHEKTYDNEKQVVAMLKAMKENKIPSKLIPRCPICGCPMEMNLRCDDTFVEDEGWHEAAKRYADYIGKYKKDEILFLELGVGFSTPVWIKYPFMRWTYENPYARYVVVDSGYADMPREIEKQSMFIHSDIAKVIQKLK